MSDVVSDGVSSDTGNTAGDALMGAIMSGMGKKDHDHHVTKHVKHGGFLSFFTVSWNVFRLIGDFCHLGGILWLIRTIQKRENCLGVSWKTQFLFTLVVITRYLDLFDNMQHYSTLGDSHLLYLIVFKLVFFTTHFYILYLFWYYNKVNTGNNYEEHKDTCNIYFLLVPCFLIALITTAETSFTEVMWTWSQYLEAAAMIPQYVFIYRHNKKEIRNERVTGVDVYIFMLGGYRGCYAMNWLYKELVGYTVLSQSVFGGLLQITLFVDFLSYLVTKKSYLRDLVLQADDKVCDVSDQIELKVFPNRAGDVEQNKLRRRNRGNPDYAPVRTDLEFMDPEMAALDEVQNYVM